MEIQKALKEIQDQNKRDYMRMMSHCMAIQQRLAELIASSQAEHGSPEWEKAKEDEKRHIDTLQKDLLDQMYVRLDQFIPPGEVARLDQRGGDDLP